MERTPLDAVERYFFPFIIRDAKSFVNRTRRRFSKTPILSPLKSLFCNHSPTSVNPFVPEILRNRSIRYFPKIVQIR